MLKSRNRPLSIGIYQYHYQYNIFHILLPFTNSWNSSPEFKLLEIKTLVRLSEALELLTYMYDDITILTLCPPHRSLKLTHVHDTTCFLLDENDKMNRSTEIVVACIHYSVINPCLCHILKGHSVIQTSSFYSINRMYVALF